MMSNIVGKIIPIIDRRFDWKTVVLFHSRNSLIQCHKNFRHLEKINFIFNSFNCFCFNQE